MKLLGEGRNRKVYLLPSGKRVIKVPTNPQGIIDNSREAYDYEKNYFVGRDKLARCRLFKGFLIMEYVEPINGSPLPEWCNYVDCRQVGYNAKKQLVAYDWA